MDIVLNGKLFTNKKAIHEYLAEVLNFPSYYGKNLDALYDCLQDINIDVTFHLENMDLYGNFIQTIIDASKVNKHILVK